MWLWTVQFFWSLLIFVNLCQSQHFLDDARENYLGCYIDAGNRLLGGLRKNFPGTLTQNICNRFCFDEGFAFAGTEYSHECFCSIYRPPDNKKAPDSQCNTKCAGNSAKVCGATWRISVYSTGYVSSIRSDTQENYLGCYIDAGNRLLGGLDKNFPGTLTPNICSQFCLDNGFSFAGTEYSNQCYCSMYGPPDDRKVPDSQCNAKCAGNSGKICGGTWRISVYNTTFMLTERSEPVDYKQPTSPSTCQLSQTSVDGRKVCTGEVIFEDEFGSSLGDKWRHVVMVSEVPDYEFAVFHADPKNCFVSNNQLIIKPTTFDDVHTLTGTLNLQGCTGTLGTRECGFHAFSFNILPPVASARINTRHSFTFRYGIVEVKAKMPVGDWLIPEIWLEPKNHLYGQNYASGRIRLAMCRGNQMLHCGGKDFGSNHLESSVVMGPENDVRVRSIASTLPNNWHDQFHTYTLIWKPDGIAFKIDNEMPRDILPAGGRLCEAIGFTNETCSIWRFGSLIAPFDTEFYISLGLSVGNTRDFPDDCVNRGRPKPWRNQELKVMLKFWLDRNNWSTTWSDEKSALHIEHIRVTAL